MGTALGTHMPLSKLVTHVPTPATSNPHKTVPSGQALLQTGLPKVWGPNPVGPARRQDFGGQSLHCETCSLLTAVSMSWFLQGESLGFRLIQPHKPITSELPFNKDGRPGPEPLVTRDLMDSSSTMLFSLRST